MKDSLDKFLRTVSKNHALSYRMFKDSKDRKNVDLAFYTTIYELVNMDREVAKKYIDLYEEFKKKSTI